MDLITKARKKIITQGWIYVVTAEGISATVTISNEGYFYITTYGCTGLPNGSYYEYAEQGKEQFLKECKEIRL